MRPLKCKFNLKSITPQDDLSEALPCLLLRKVSVSWSKNEHHKIGAKTTLQLHQNVNISRKGN